MVGVNLVSGGGLTSWRDQLTSILVFNAGTGWTPPAASTEELAQVQGTLYLLRKNSAKGARECIFTTAVATVRRTETPFSYQLAIMRAYEEGEAELLDDMDEEEEEEREFLLREELKPRIGTFENQQTLIWRDLEEADEGGSPSDENLYEFVVDERTDPNIFNHFFESVLRAIFERKTGSPSDNVPMTELMKTFSDGTLLPLSAPEQDPVPASVAEVGDDDYLVMETSDLYIWDMELEAFRQPDMVENPVEIRIVQTGQYQYYLRAKSQGMWVLGHKITDDINGKANAALRSFTWNHTTARGIIEAWCLKFLYPETYTRFTNVMGMCIYEAENAMDWSKIKEIEQDYVITAMTEDVDMTDVEEDEAAVEGALNEDSEQSDESEEEEHTDWGPNKEKNSGLAVGHKGISVVLRGGQVGIFKETTDGKLELGGSVRKIAAPGRDGKAFNPNKMMLHDQDRSLVLMNPNNANSLYKMDLETGKVVDEWKLTENVAINSMTPVDKLAQTTVEQTLLGTSHNALFRIDPRLSGSKLVQTDMKQYTTKNKFSSIVTTGAGNIAVGSEKGEIRLFDALGKNAKTLLPGLGDAIRGIDVTKDGRWVIATCKTYLLLIDTQIGTGKYVGSSGFTRSFPADSKPTPKKLQLRPEHVAYMKAAINFSPAKFNTGRDAKETTIVTSNGPFVIAWNFEKVKKGILDKYEIKRFTANVVEDNFSFGNDKDIIVTLTDDVYMLPKRALTQFKGRKSLVEAPADRPSRSNIVNAPY